MTARELKLFDQHKQEAQFLRRESQAFRAERDALRVEMFEADQRMATLEADVARLTADNARLLRQVQQLTAAAAAASDEAVASPPAFVRPDVPAAPPAPGPQGRPRRGAAAPARVDAELDVPLPVDAAGRPCCPACRCSLSDVRDHQRLVEDVVPARVVVTRYRTASGHCAMCRRRVESRAPAQPPAADLPHAQLGLNALATAAVLRVVHRLPMRQVTRVLGDLAGLSVSAGAIAKQLRRLARWLAPCRERILLALRAAPRVNADETGWRTDGRNGYLWAITGPAHTLYHVDQSRGGAVIRGLLGDAFAGTLTADFYAAYNALACPKQRCLAHLLRELAESAAKHPAFAATAFRADAVKLVKSMLALKERWAAMGDDAYTRAACRLEDRLGRLARATHDEPNADRLAKRMLRHERELTAFLWDKDLEPTNNAAERALRPAVVARKISGGSRSAAGAEAWATLATLMRTAGQQGRHVLEVVRQLLTDAWAGREPLALLA